MRIIDADAFKEEYLCFGYIPEMSEEEFDSFPSVEYSGEWIDLYPKNEIQCSICNGKVPYVLHGWGYCPHCGAKMSAARLHKKTD